MLINLMKFLYQGWLKIGHLLGWINTRIILAILFFVLITPLGKILRACGKDPLKKHYDPHLPSYRKIVIPPPINHMEKPF